jgi:predicted ATPase/class 3 adenylate cyclase
VLFCDLVGSTKIASQLDPEEWRKVIAAYHRSANEAITRFGGHVAKYLGDGVMAYFGWPEAHENDAERAARAGLVILEEVAKLDEQSPPASPSPMAKNGGVNMRPKISVRVGIDSGAVVVGAGAGKDTDIFGETPNIAALVQAAAAPDTMLLTASTHRLVSGLFVVEERGTQEFKDIANPIELYRVLRPTGVRGRLAAARGLTPFVGREEELRLLLSRWERARDAEGQLVLIGGEAGIGKSRLAAEFHQCIRDTPHVWMESAGEQFFQNTPFHAVTEMLSQWLVEQEASSPNQRMELLERALVSAGLKLEDCVPLIADLLQLPVGDSPAIALTPEQRRRRLLAALTGWICGVARSQPVVMVVEDLHWLDPSSLELVQLLAEQGVMVPLMLLCTTRPEFHHQWPMRSHHAQITLNRLSARNVREMVAQVAAHNALNSQSVDAVIERTGGNPLFVEELTRAVLESGGARITEREIPATLHDSLMARLDRLGPARVVIQIGSVIGSEFSYGLLHAVHPIPENDLQGALRSATDAELIYVRGIPPDAAYQFKHALIRDAAYEALLRSRRKELHSRIAEVLVEQFRETVTSSPEVLAQHYTEAGITEQAISYWQRAGQRAIERSANREVISHFTKGLELLKSTADSAQRDNQELTLQTALGASLIAVKGYAAPEVEPVYARARELCHRVGETPLLFRVLGGLSAFYLVRGDFHTSHELGEQLLHLAQNMGNPSFLLRAHSALGPTLFYLGEFAPSQEHLEQGLALYHAQRHHSHATFLQDPGVSCLCYLAWDLWFLGYPDQALKRIDEAVTLAQNLSHPYSRAYSYAFAAMIHNFRGESEEAQEQAEAAIALSTQQGFMIWLAQATVSLGRAVAHQGQEEGVAQVRQGLTAWRATGAEVCSSYNLGVLAEAYGKWRRADEGLDVVSEALALMASKTGDLFYEAELYRLKGELLLQQAGVQRIASGVETEAERCFLRAIDIARHQQAKSLELRAVRNLARLLSRHGRGDNAHAMLAEIYGWFTEGFDTADLKDAKVLLDELSR